MVRRIAYLVALVAAAVGAGIAGAGISGPPQERAEAISATVTSLGAGNIHACAGMSDGTAWCWGDNALGQLGDAATFGIGSTRPVTVDSLTGAGTLEASTSAYHNCVLAGPSSIKCWGRNDFGQLGSGATSPYSVTPVAVIVPGVSQVSPEAYFTCAIGSGGAASCWGLNSDGQLGDGTTTDRLVPTAVVGLPAAAVDVDAGLVSACAVLTSGSVYCWGFGIGPTPALVTGISDATDVAVGTNHQCVRRSTGGVKCWGLGTSGELGHGSFSSSATPVDVTGLSDATSIDAGGAHSCATRAGGAVVCWGDNGVGQIGDGTFTDRNVPTAVSGLSAAELALGGAFSCARTSSGGAKCWGSNFYGQLGDCSTTNRWTPVSVDFDGRRCDTDGDALPDYWEETGDLDGDGDMDLDLPAMGADSAVKDLFIEIDWMDCAAPGSDCVPGHSDAVDPRALAAVIAQYWCAPERIVAHIDAGPASIMNPTVDSCGTRRVSGATWGALSMGAPYAHNSGKIFSPNTSLGPNRLKVFHLGLMQHQVPDGPFGPAGGWGQMPGTTTWYGIGAETYPRPITNQELWHRQAGIVMHEVGHNLGLGHGGGTLNYKPNHLSVMNYAFGSVGLITGGAINVNWDYSRADLDDLSESALNEVSGLNPDALVMHTGARLGTIWICQNGGGIDFEAFSVGVAVDARTNVDYDCDGAEDGGGAGSCVDGQDNGSDGAADQGDPDCAAAFETLVSSNIGGGEYDAGVPGQLLPGHLDWLSLVFDGGPIGDESGPLAFLQTGPGATAHADSIESPPIPDFDSDGLIDAAETQMGADPLDPDADDDELEDGYETGVVESDPADRDTDDDGCTDGEEMGSVPNAGGMRSPVDHYDFYDVTGDRGVDLSDTLLILDHFGHGATFDALDDELDRTLPDPSQPWRTAASDDGVDLTDALNSLDSFGDSCSK